MSLAAVYQRFLSRPTTGALADNASLIYVTSAQSFRGANEVHSHLQKQTVKLKKKSEKALNVVENGKGLFLEVQTVINFEDGGGAYLPGLDENLVADHEVTLMILHVVEIIDHKIRSIRLHWDQGALLKAIDVIGARGRNWPIKDGSEQSKLVAASVNASEGAADFITKQVGDVSITSRPTRRVNPTRDPHASLDFSQMPQEELKKIVAPYAASSDKPAERDWKDLFASGSSPIAERASSPTKGEVAPKIGAGKNYGPSRLWDSEEEERKHKEEDAGTPRAGSPDKKYLKPHPKKYNHFEFSDGSDEPPQEPSPPRPNTKHQSQWDFADFVTPVKVHTKQNSLAQRHFDFADDEAETPVRRTAAGGKPRRDAQAHFELQDDGGEATAKPRPAHARGQSIQNEYKTHLTMGEDGVQASPNRPERRPAPPQGLTNVEDRKKDFAAHWQISDTAPAEPAPAKGRGADLKETSTSTNLKDRSKDFDSKWSATDSPSGVPESASASDHQNLSRNEKARSRMFDASWNVGDERGTPQSAVKRRGPGGYSELAAGGMGDAAPESPLARTTPGKENRGIKTAGDGMGRAKGARSWMVGDDDELPEDRPVKPKAGAQERKRESLWDF